jgi:adenine nucleotide transporter 17
MISNAEPVDHALSGSVSSMAVFSLLYPLDVARTRQQARCSSDDAGIGDSGKRTPSGTVAMLSSILEREGARGLYAGLSANIVSIGVSQALYFFFYELIKDVVLAATNRRRRQRERTATVRTTLLQDLFIAFVSGTINATVTCPMWVAATRLKLASRRHRRGRRRSPRGDIEKDHAEDDKDDGGEATGATFARSLVDVVRSGDAWKGLGPSLILCSNPALQYGIYEQLKQQLLFAWANRRAGRVAGEVLNPVPAFVIGAVAKTVATIFTYPLQLVQTRTREEGFRGGMWEASQALIAESGFSVAPYFRGMNSKLVMTVLNASLMFMTKEWMLWMVLKGKALLGPGAFRFLRWSGFLSVALYSVGEMARVGMKGEEEEEEEK